MSKTYQITLDDDWDHQLAALAKISHVSVEDWLMQAVLWAKVKQLHFVTVPMEAGQVTVVEASPKLKPQPNRRRWRLNHVEQL